MDAEAIRKAIAQKAAALRKADAALKDAAALPSPLPAASAYAADEAARALDAALRDAADIAAVLAQAAEYRADLERRVQGALADASARLTGQIAAALSKEAPVTGQLPELRWGLLRLEFKLSGAKREVVIWFGPKVAKLASAPADVDAVVGAAREARASLDAVPMDAAAFLAELQQAYEATRRKAGGEAGAQVPILALLRELTLARQPAAFLADPTREHFVSYSRVQFSYDLYRARLGAALKPGVAAHAQTKRPEDHLWVPTSPEGDGTHFATLSVKERRDG